MFGSNFIEKLKTIGATTSQLGSLQIQLYLHEMRQARGSIALMFVLMMVAMSLLIAGIALSLVAAVWLLVEAGYTASVAILFTGGATLLLLLIVSGCIYFIALGQARRFTAPNEELRANFACVRDQLLKNW